MKLKESKKRKLTKQMKLKLAGIFGGTLLALLGLLLGITIINTRKGNQYSQQVLSQSQQQYSSMIIPFKRGSISDRNGTVLANSVKVYNLILDCKALGYTNTKKEQPYKQPTIEALEQYFGIDPDKVESLLSNEKTKDSRYYILKQEITLSQFKKFERNHQIPDSDDKKTIEKLGKEEIARRRNVQGIYFEDDYKRLYPLNELACDVIGFADRGNVADWGLEGYYNSTLNGKNGRKYGYLDEKGSLAHNIIEPENGKNLTITLDATIQEIVEKYINAFDRALSAGPNNKKGEKRKGAENIAVMIMNPNNGEVLAMGSSDMYDLNDPRDLSGVYTEEQIDDMDDEQRKEALYGMWKNYCVSQNYEPGSTYKPIVVASALESGAVSEYSRFMCDGGQQIAETFVKCAVYPGSHGAESLGEVIQNSCNDGMMAVGRRMGTKRFLEYQRKFNFGTRTGIDLPSEEAGLLFSEDNMYEMELSTSAFGQGFNCTMVQEIAAMAATINGGTYYKPHLVKEITDEDGKTVKKITPVVMKQAVSSEVSAKVREYMGMSVKSGTSKFAKVQGYSMGGKTGTAEKLNAKDKGNYLVSFIGFAPLDQPEMLIYAIVDTPNAKNQASSKFAQYLAQAIMSEVLPYMNIYKDEPSREETVLWQGFYGVPKMTDIDEDGVSNPYGTILDQGYGRVDPDDMELNDQNTDGITNEDAELED